MKRAQYLQVKMTTVTDQQVQPVKLRKAQRVLFCEENG